MLVLGFGTYDTSAHPRVAVLLDGLRAHGHTVEECNVPLGLDTRGRVATLQQPWRVPLLVLTIARRWTTLARMARRAGRPDLVLVGYLGHFDVLLARRLFRKTPIVLDLLISGAETASDRQVGGRLAGRVLTWLDRAAVHSADVVVVDTDEHRELLPETRRRESVVVPVGATQAWFDAGAAAARTRADAADAPLRVVFFGLYTPLQGAPVIGDAIRLLADAPVEITMIGDGQDFAATRRAVGPNARVTWTSWVPGVDLPGVVAAHDVCLGIFGTGAKALRVVPTKVYQGLAAGTVVVTSDTAPQRRTLGDAAVFVPPGDPAALAAALRDLAYDRERVRAQRVVSAEAAVAIASPQAVTADLATSIEGRLQSIEKERR